MNFMQRIRSGTIPGNAESYVKILLKAKDDDVDMQEYLGMTDIEWEKFCNRPTCILHPKQIGGIGITSSEEDAVKYLHSQLDNSFKVGDNVYVSGEGGWLFRVVQINGNSAALTKEGHGHGWESFRKMEKVTFKVLNHSHTKISDNHFTISILSWDRFNHTVRHLVEYKHGELSIRWDNEMGAAIYLQRPASPRDVSPVVHKFFDYSHMKKFLTFTDAVRFKDPAPDMEDLGISSSSLVAGDPWVVKGIHPKTRQEVTFELSFDRGVFYLRDEEGTTYLTYQFGGVSVTYDQVWEYFEGKVYVDDSDW